MVDVPANTTTTAFLETTFLNGDLFGTYSGRIDTPGDHDWIRVNLVAGESYAFYISAEQTGHELGGDSNFTLRDAAGNAIAGADDGGVAKNSFLSFTATATGIHYIDVSLVIFDGNELGTYSLLMTDSDIGANAPQSINDDNAVAGQDHWLMGGQGDDLLDLSAGGNPGGPFGFAALGEQDDDQLLGNSFANALSGGLGDDNAFGQGGNDLVFGDAGDDRLRGGGGNDQIFGGDGFDHLSGGEDDDRLVGGADGDRLEGEAGEDAMNGGAGDDIVLGGDGNDTIQIAGSEALGDSFDGGTGTDKMQVLGGAAATLPGFNAAVSSIEQWQGLGQGLLGTSAGNVFNLGALTSMTGLLFVDGLGGNDTITGSNFADNLRGNVGNDTLSGGAGNDFIGGGLGRDILFGGPDADRFDFNSKSESVKGGNRDQIMDFQRGPDHIDVRDIDAQSGSGNQNFKWIGKSDFHDKKGELRYEDKGATVIVQGDVNGDGKADFEIFVNVGALSKGDFIL